MVKWLGLLMQLIDLLKAESFTYKHDFNSDTGEHSLYVKRRSDLKERNFTSADEAVLLKDVQEFLEVKKEILRDLEAAGFSFQISHTKGQTPKWDFCLVHGNNYALATNSYSEGMEFLKQQALRLVDVRSEFFLKYAKRLGPYTLPLSIQQSPSKNTVYVVDAIGKGVLTANECLIKGVQKMVEEINNA